MMEQLIPDTKFNEEYFIPGQHYVLISKDSGKSVDALLLYFDDDQLCFVVIGQCENSSGKEAKKMYVPKEQVENGTTIISRFDPMRLNMVEVLAEIGVPVTASEVDMHRRCKEVIGSDIWDALDCLERGIRPRKCKNVLTGGSENVRER